MSDGDPTTPRVAQDVHNVQDGTLLEVFYETTGGSLREQVTAIIQNSLAQCGIKTNIQLHELAGWFAGGPEGIFGRRFDLGEFAFLTGVEPPCDLYLSSDVTGPLDQEWISIQDGMVRQFPNSDWSGSNNPGFADMGFDAACSTALNSLVGEPGYEAGHREAQRIFAEQLPIAPLFLRIKTAATRPDFCNFIMDPTSNSEFWNIEEFDYGEGCSD